MQNRIIQFWADSEALHRSYPLDASERTYNRFLKFYADSESVASIPFSNLSHEEQVDALLLKWKLRAETSELKQQHEANQRVWARYPFLLQLTELIEKNYQKLPVDPQASANLLNEANKACADAAGAISPTFPESESEAIRATKMIREVQSSLRNWFNFYNGYDPMFSWWVAKPHTSIQESLTNLYETIRSKRLGITGQTQDKILGESIGRKALQDALKAELIPYSPEELIAYAQTQYDWCEKQMKIASREMGFGDNWKDALEKVKNDYVEPGKQPEMIKNLALEAIDYVKSNDMMTIPPLAEETWRMAMMSPERQKVSPFFLGGETIIVSFPTDTMNEDEKLMSLRANNIHFARATVHHELIPGHHMQQFMTSRYRSYRQGFNTPFWTEGWALYWEFLLWDRGFAKSPENRIGMLFWRMHRCARIIFSLKFHLGEMSAQECVEYLVDKVGHERSTAEGEVRRSFGGDYPPLYQAAYMLGAFQLMALRHELVDSKKMTEKQFHDEVMQQNNMPIALLRQALVPSAMKAEPDASWRFLPGS